MGKEPGRGSWKAAQLSRQFSPLRGMHADQSNDRSCHCRRHGGSARGLRRNLIEKLRHHRRSLPIGFVPLSSTPNAHACATFSSVSSLSLIIASHHRRLLCESALRQRPVTLRAKRHVRGPSLRPRDLPMLCRCCRYRYRYHHHSLVLVPYSTPIQQ